MINKEINELRTKIYNIKEEATKNMENLRKKNKTKVQNKMEGPSRRLEQVEDRISELEDEMVTKGKTEELLVNNSRPVKRKCKNLLTPSKDQT
jgi:DNA-binding protein H-NS